MTLAGKGFYIWYISRCEGGNVQAIANLAVQSGLTHALIKIADGEDPYNIDSTTGVDLVPPLVQALNSRGITAWGWHYVYGFDPNAEADIAIQRIQQTGVSGYIIDAEAEYKTAGSAVARQFMIRLRATLPSFPMALSSYRYPTYHPSFPFQAFLERCDYNMPQVYWQEAHNPGEQLARCVREFEAITPFRPIIPTGAAYKAGSWQPTSQDLIEFMDTARSLNLTAANFWEWGHTRMYLPQLWDVIAAYNWQGGPSDAELAARYIAALNTHNPAVVLGLYDNNAVHVTRSRTNQGLSLINQWYTYLLGQYLPNATFTLGTETRRPGSSHFAWTAVSSAGDVNDGQDAIGIVGGKIVYHYTMFTVTP